MVTKSLKEILGLPAKTVLPQIKGKLVSAGEYVKGEKSGVPFTVQDFFMEDDTCSMSGKLAHHDDLSPLIGEEIAIISAKKPTGQLVGVKVDEMIVDDEGTQKTVKYLAVSKSAEIVKLASTEEEPAPVEEEEEVPEAKPEPKPKPEPAQQDMAKTKAPLKDKAPESVGSITPTELRYDQTINTGNYCSVKIGLTVSLTDGASPVEALEKCRDFIAKHGPKAAVD